jgi:site-specific recombinase XerD
VATSRLLAHEANCHTFRHFSATHLLTDGYEIRTIYVYRWGHRRTLHFTIAAQNFLSELCQEIPPVSLLMNYRLLIVATSGEG